MLKNRKLVIVVLYLLLFLWIFFIFYNSSLDADHSNASSGVLVKFIFEKLFGIDYGCADTALVDLVTRVVRKAAHFSEYALLSAIAYLVAFFHRKPMWFCPLFATLFSAAIGALDEYSQQFSAGRSPQPIDVLIDTSGAFFTALVLFCIFWLRYRKKHKKEL